MQSRRNSQRMKRRWSNPRERRRLEKFLEAGRARLRKDPGFRERNRQIAIAAWRDPKFRARIRAFQKKHWKNPTVRKQSYLIAKRLMSGPSDAPRLLGFSIFPDLAPHAGTAGDAAPFPVPAVGRSPALR